jgi:hypothetical protein
MRCGNSGKNWQFQKDLIKLPAQIKLESTALNRLKQNVRKFAMLYGKASAMILSNKLPKFFKIQLWAQTAKLAIQMEDIIVHEEQRKSPNEINLKWIKNMREFGGAGILYNNTKIS